MMIYINKASNHTVALLLIATVSCFVLNSCNGHNESSHSDPENYTIDGSTVILTENSTIASKLAFHTVAEQDFAMEMATSGMVRAIPTAYAEIAPPFAGRVLKSYVRLGEKVNAGAPIFEISSPDYFNAQKDYFDAKQEFRQAESNLERQ